MEPPPGNWSEVVSPFDVVDQETYHLLRRPLLVTPAPVAMKMEADGQLVKRLRRWDRQREAAGAPAAGKHLLPTPLPAPAASATSNPKQATALFSAPMRKEKFEGACAGPPASPAFPEASSVLLPEPLAAPRAPTKVIVIPAPPAPPSAEGSRRPRKRKHKKKAGKDARSEEAKLGLHEWPQPPPPPARIVRTPPRKR
ncbi:unnamed protein product [Prorocentrum cordatum]|uniref:Uncharacterized protein n=1 Tax=Prorocentrum cordatum TaxID=2364126 RepID=A0ABN9X0C2_9DINO|nr:unnamed protein product [Polarella glacialis]